MSLEDYADIDLETVVPMTDEEVKRVREKIALLGADLPRPPMPQMPTFGPTTSMKDKLRKMQKFIESFQYNYTDSTYFSLRKNRPLHQILGTAREVLGPVCRRPHTFVSPRPRFNPTHRCFSCVSPCVQIVRDALPIRCLEAVFLALHLTQGMTEIDRYPVSFKSTVAGQCYRHIVLAIKVDGKFGALGLSRRSTLMFKDFTYDSFGDLIEDYRDSYEQCFHRLLTVNTGLPISHQDYKAMPICWRCLKVKLFKHEWELLHAGLNAYIKDTGKLQHFWERTGKKPNVSAYSHDVPKEEGGGVRAAAAATQSHSHTERWNPCRRRRRRALCALACSPLTLAACVLAYRVAQGGATPGAGGEGDTDILDSDEEEDAAEQAAEEAEVVAQAAGSAASAGMSRSDAAV